MTDKSYVTMEQHVCLVCTKTFDTGALLLDRQLRNLFDRNTVTDWGLCPDCKKLHDDGYIALVVIDPARSDAKPGANVRPQDAFRTGEIIHMRRTVFAQIFAHTLHDHQPMIFIDPEVAARIKAIPVADDPAPIPG